MACTQDRPEDAGLAWPAHMFPYLLATMTYRWIASFRSSLPCEFMHGSAHVQMHL